MASVNWVFIGASNELGAFESGVAAKLFGTVPSVVAGGLLTLGVVGLVAARCPALRRSRPGATSSRRTRTAERLLSTSPLEV